MQRREFLSYSATTSLGCIFSRAAMAENLSSSHTPEKILDLADGFSYQVISQTGNKMSDGYYTPGKPDGMGCFQGPDRTLILMRNHELDPTDFNTSPYRRGQQPPSETYDRTRFGGVTRVVLDQETLEVQSDNLVLVGSERNCAGGISPWGWLSCEETLSNKHGYVFLCDPMASKVQPAKRISGYGRFNHEAVAIDPDTHIAYLTEDRGDGCLYRFVPHKKSKPFIGQLQAMKIKDEWQFKTDKNMQIGDHLDLEWVDIEDATPSDDSLRFVSRQLGAARVNRGEGIWYFDNKVYFSATEGGKAKKGQIFCLTLGAEGKKQSLSIVAEARIHNNLDMPDNITVSPSGQIFVAEDGTGMQYIRMITSDGKSRDLARNRISSSEFAGVCFSPDGKTLFANMQKDGLTVAISGPFETFG